MPLLVQNRSLVEAPCGCTFVCGHHRECRFQPTLVRTSCYDSPVGRDEPAVSEIPATSKPAAAPFAHGLSTGHARTRREGCETAHHTPLSRSTSFCGPRRGLDSLYQQALRVLGCRQHGPHFIDFLTGRALGHVDHLRVHRTHQPPRTVGSYTEVSHRLSAPSGSFSRSFCRWRRAAGPLAVGDEQRSHFWRRSLLFGLSTPWACVLSDSLRPVSGQRKHVTHAGE